MTKQQALKPTITVIIPVFNAASMLQKVLQALSDQTYPRDLVEVIVVDNGSTDNTQEIANTFGVKLLYETDIKSPYAARNKGLHHASGAILAFTDANKVPERQWLQEGVEALAREQTDLAGGDIRFGLGETPTAAEVYDAITYNDNRTYVLKEGGSATGNLFCRREVVEKTGLFPGHLRSGMDMWWSQKAVREGFKLVFAEKAIVWCQPRNLKSLLKKSWRVGTMHPFVFHQSGKSTSYILDQTFRSFAPPKIKPMRQKILLLGKPVSLPKVWCVAWMCKGLMGLGRLRGLGLLRRKEFGIGNSEFR